MRKATLGGTMNTKKLAALCLTGALAISAMTGCGINKNATAASFSDGTTVTMEVTNFVIRYQQVIADSFYRQIFGDEVWTKDVSGNGSTMADTVKSSVMDSLHEMYTLKNHMADYNVSLTDEENTAIADAADAFLAGNDADTLDEIGATRDAVIEFLTLQTIKDKMTSAIYATADTNVSDEEANMRAYTMLTFSTAGSYDEDNNLVELTGEEKAAIETEAADVYAEITEPADLETVAEAHDVNPTTGTYAADNTSLNEDVKTALDALHEGEMSELIKTDSALYIVRLDKETDEDATESNRESIIEDRQTSLYDEVLAGWQEDDGWKVSDKQIAKIQLKNTFSQPSTEDTESTETTEDTAAEETETTEDTAAEETETTEGTEAAQE